ncbi:uncharacterized protein LOC135825663 [Sycon ciliatum]|uniref:uncharacterized protein LOC135825663 n=1 Tax=Sycon ciliatum TaxID=27933 RepID=UPI0031F6A62C
MQAINTIVLVCLAVTMARAHLVQGKGESCMVRRMVKAGITHSKAQKFEKNALQVPVPERIMSSMNLAVLGYVLRGSLAEANAVQGCIRKSSKACKTYSPCANGGVCQLSPTKKSYVCKCHTDFTGDFCLKLS